ncbi:MAG: CBS domain-containing protein [Terriglobia bacterium]
MGAAKLVGDVMTREVTTVAPDTKLLDASLLFRSTGFRHLPVVSDGRLVGILSDRDVERASPTMLTKVSPEEYNRIFEATPVSKVMTADPITVTCKTPIKEAVTMMVERKISALPVAEADSKLAGLITTTDLLTLLDRLLADS